VKDPKSNVKCFIHAKKKIFSKKEKLEIKSQNKEQQTNQPTTKNQKPKNKR
jgi:hypothetical protein